MFDILGITKTFFFVKDFIQGKMDITKLSIEDLLKHPHVQELYQIIHQLRLDFEALQIELRKFKKLPAKPNIKPSKLDDPQEDTPEDKTTQENNPEKKRPGSAKRSKTKDLVIRAVQF